MVGFIFGYPDVIHVQEAYAVLLVAQDVVFYCTALDIAEKYSPAPRLFLMYVQKDVRGFDPVIVLYVAVCYLHVRRFFGKDADEVLGHLAILHFHVVSIYTNTISLIIPFQCRPVAIEHGIIGIYYDARN